MGDVWNDAYDIAQANQKSQGTVAPSPDSEDDEWGQAYNTVVGEAKPKERGTFGQRLKGASARGWMQLGESVLRLPALVVGQAKLVSQYTQAERIHAAKSPIEQKLLRRELGSMEKAYDGMIAELSQSAEWHEQGQQKIIENHPEWESEPPENIKDLILSPDKLSIAIAESLPVLVSAGILTAAGQPNIATALMFATESESARDEAKANGESDDTARDAALVYGLVAAGIEQLQLGQAMKIGKGAYKAILNRSVQQITKKGVKSVTKAIVETSIKEAVEEMVQGTWGEVTAKTIYDKPMLDGGGVMGFVDRRAQEAYIGFMMGAIPGVGGAVAGRAVRGARGGPSAGISLEVPDTPRRPIGKDSSPEELSRDIKILEKGHMPQIIQRMTGVQGGLDNLLEMGSNPKFKDKAKRTRAGVEVALGKIRAQIDQVAGYTLKNPNTLKEGNKVLPLLDKFSVLADSFLENPSRNKLRKISRLQAEIARIGKGHMNYFEDAVKTLRKHPGYENVSVEPIDLEGTGHPIAPITSTVPGETIDDIARRGDTKALEEAQSTDDVVAKGGEPIEYQTEAGTIPSEAPYTIVETQSGLQIRDKQTGRIVEHFDTYDKQADRNAVRLLKKLNSGPRGAMKYDGITAGQRARITILGKRLGLMDKKGKSLPAFRRFAKGTTGKTGRSKLTYGDAKKLIDAMEKHQPTFREGDRVTPKGIDVVGEVIQVNSKRGTATVQFKNKTTGDVSSKIFNMEELAFLGDVQVATEEMAETIRQSQKIGTPKDEVLGQKENRLLKKYWQKTKRQVTGWHLGQLRVARMLEWLDGYDKGVNWTRIFLPMNEASMRADEAINGRLGGLQEFMQQTFGPDGTKRLLTGKKTPVADPNFKDKILLSPAERVGYYVLTKNKDGLRRLKRGNLGSFGNSEEALKAVLESVTEEEKQLGDWALGQLQEQYPRANQAAIIALGRELTPEDNYFPLYSPADETDMGQQMDFLTELEDKIGVPKTSIEIAETQERVHTSTGSVETDFFRSYLHNIARVERFVNMAPAVNEVQNLLNNKDYRHTLNKATDGYGVKILQHWMKDTTKGKSSEINDWTGKLLTGLRRNAMVYAIGYNIPSVMRQTLSLGNAMAIDPLMMKHVPSNWMKNKQGWDNYRSMENEVMGKSIMMRTRSFDRVESILNSVSAVEKRMLGKQDYSRRALGFIRWMDRHTTVLAWRSLYDVATDRHLSEEAAVAYADDGISKTQPMGNARDLPDFFRGGPLQKLLTTFQNQVNQNYNFWTHDIAGSLKAGKISKKTAAYRVMFSYVVPAMLFGMVGRGGPPEDWKDVVKDLALYPLGSLFLVGRIVYNAAQGFAGGGTSIAEIGVSELEKTIAAGFAGDVGKVVKHGTKAVGALTGRIPAQAIRTAEGLYDLAQNETDDYRRLIYSEWALSRGDKGGTAPAGRKRKLRRSTGPRKRKLRRK